MTSIEDIIKTNYKQRFFKECRYIWKNYVPANGQAECLQGELLREIEKIRCEAQDNGNINWDEDFSFFCDFITGSLCRQSVFSDRDKEEITLIMSYIKACGIYARKYADGEISDEDVDVNRLAYVEDNLYDIICDKIGQFQKENPNPVPLEKNYDIKR